MDHLDAENVVVLGAPVALFALLEVLLARDEPMPMPLELEFVELFAPMLLLLLPAGLLLPYNDVDDGPVVVPPIPLAADAAPAAPPPPLPPVIDEPTPPIDADEFVDDDC